MTILFRFIMRNVYLKKVVYPKISTQSTIENVLFEPYAIKIMSNFLGI